MAGSTAISYHSFREREREEGGTKKYSVDIMLQNFIHMESLYISSLTCATDIRKLMQNILHHLPTTNSEAFKLNMKAIKKVGIIFMQNPGNLSHFTLVGIMLPHTELRLGMSWSTHYSQ
jgi:hypothetical protein